MPRMKVVSVSAGQLHVTVATSPGAAGDGDWRKSVAVADAGAATAVMPASVSTRLTPAAAARRSRRGRGKEDAAGIEVPLGARGAGCPGPGRAAEGSRQIGAQRVRA